MALVTRLAAGVHYKLVLDAVPIDGVPVTYKGQFICYMDSATYKVAAEYIQHYSDAVCVFEAGLLEAKQIVEMLPALEKLIMNLKTESSGKYLWRFENSLVEYSRNRERYYLTIVVSDGMKSKEIRTNFDYLHDRGAQAFKNLCKVYVELENIFFEDDFERQRLQTKTVEIFLSWYTTEQPFLDKLDKMLSHLKECFQQSYQKKRERFEEVFNWLKRGDSIYEADKVLDEFHHYWFSVFCDFFKSVVGSTDSLLERFSVESKVNAIIRWDRTHRQLFLCDFDYENGFPNIRRYLILTGTPLREIQQKMAAFNNLSAVELPLNHHAEMVLRGLREVSPSIDHYFDWTPMTRDDFPKDERGEPMVCILPLQRYDTQGGHFEKYVPTLFGCRMHQLIYQQLRILLKDEYKGFKIEVTSEKNDRFYHAWHPEMIGKTLVKFGETETLWVLKNGDKIINDSGEYYSFTSCLISMLGIKASVRNFDPKWDDLVVSISPEATAYAGMRLFEDPTQTIFRVPEITLTYDGKGCPFGVLMPLDLLLRFMEPVSVSSRLTSELQ